MTTRSATPSPRCPRSPAAPHPPPARASLPHPLTFFLTTRQRNAVLRRLRGHDAHDRTTALLRALRLDATSHETDPPATPHATPPKTPHRGTP